MSVVPQIPLTTAVAPGGVATFTFNFYLASAADHRLKINGVLKTLGVDYTISGVGNQNGGSITITPAPNSGDIVTQYRATAIKRDTDYQTGGDFNADVVDLDFDRIWLALQEIVATAAPSNALRGPIGESIDELPAASVRKGYTLAFDSSTGQPMLTIPTSGSAAQLTADLANSATNKGSDLVWTSQLYTGAIGRKLRDKLREIPSVLDFNAKGDGVTDDAAAFTFAGSIASSPTVFVPAGNYRLASSPAPTGTVTWIIAPGVTFTGAGVLGGRQSLLGSRSVTLASAATVAVGAALADTVFISGTNTISGFDSVPADLVKRVVFQGSLILTHNGVSFILPGASNIATQPGDSATFVSLGLGNWQCVAYMSANQAPHNHICRVYRNAAFTTSSGSYAKIPFDSTTYDTNLLFNVANNRIIPKIAGYYRVTLRASVQATAANQLFSLSIYKNGAEDSRGSQTQSNTAVAIGLVADGVVFCNGTTDYIEGFVFASAALSIETGPTLCYLTLQGPLN
jgi:hypothetical protein